MLAKVARTPLFLVLITPRHPTSKGQFRTLNPFPLISKASLSYRSTFLDLAASKEVALSKGTVNSRRTTLLGVEDLSTITISGMYSAVQYSTVQCN